MRHWMIEYFADIKRTVLQSQSAGRAVTVYSDDVFLVSYPRVGSNWVRFLICNLINPEATISLPAAEAQIPGIYSNSDRVLRRLPRPRIVKSHEPFESRYPRVIYIVRDPRDVAVSRYYFTLKWRGFPNGYPMEEFVKQRFLLSSNAVLNTGTWGDHVFGWLTHRAGNDGFLLVRYEDLKGNTTQELRRIAKFLGLEPDPAKIALAIKNSSFDRMRLLDQKNPLKWLKRARKDVPFIREGRMGGWESVLPPVAVEAIESAWWPLMQLLGYDLVSNSAKHFGSPKVNPAVCECLGEVIAASVGACKTGANRD